MQKLSYLPASGGLVALHCGNNWNNGVHCGPRTVNLNNYPWNVNTNIGSRLACGKVFKHVNNTIRTGAEISSRRVSGDYSAF